jgi:hypothetical protein
MTREDLENLAWNRKHKDFKGIQADGVRHMMLLVNGHTESWPLSEFSENQLWDNIKKAACNDCGKTTADLAEARVKFTNCGGVILCNECYVTRF